MKKNKKLKKHFKKLLNQQIFNETKKNTAKAEEEKSSDQQSIDKNNGSKDYAISDQEKFVKKDLLRTIVISLTIIGFMVMLALYINKNSLNDEATNLFLKLFGGK